MKSARFLSLALLILIFAFSTFSYADVPQMINYQGKITTPAGALIDDTLSMVFTIYDAATDGNALWTETQPSVVVEKGIFSVLLGSVNPIPDTVFTGDVRYLGVKVEADPEMTPRKPIVSVPYAYRAATADGGGGNCGWIDDGSVVRLANSADNVGIGTTSPNEKLEITGNLRMPLSTSTAGIIKIGADRFIHSYGTGNTFIGKNAGNLTMTGYSNTGNGMNTLYSNTTGYDNTTNGVWVLYSNTTGYHNTANGVWALYSNTTGHENTANGWQALLSNITGNNNTAVGMYALYSNTTGNNNTALGYNADVSSDALTNATAIGYGAIVDASNKVRIGNTSVTSIGGQVGWTTFSDGRYKKNISENVPGLSFISKLKPVTFTIDVDAIDAVLRTPHQPFETQSEQDLKPSAEEIASKQAQSQIVYTGFIAQEVEQSAKETGYDFSGVDAPKSDKGMYGLRYAEFVVPLVKAMQEQQAQIQQQQGEIRELKQRIEELEKK